MPRKPLFIVLFSLVAAMVAPGAHADVPAPRQADTSASPDGDPTDAPARDPAYMPDRVLVQLKPASAEQTRPRSGKSLSSGLFGIPSLDAVSAQVGATRAAPAISTAPENSSVATELGLQDWVLIELAPGSDVQAAVAAYRADPGVEWAEPDYIFQPLVKPTDPLYATNWGHNNTAQYRAWSPFTNAHTGAFVGTVGFDANAEAGWAGPNGFGSPDVIIAILDTGVDLTHPDLTVVAGYDTGDNDPNPEDNSATPGHGTACVGVAAAKANNGIGACGSAPGCSIMPMKVTNSFGAFAFLFIANAIVWAADHGADFISMSFGFYFPPGEGSALVNAAIDYADAAGVVMFSGTGNANNGWMLYPASHAKVISVGAASMCGGRKRSSSNPAYLAPGVSPDPNNVSCDNVRWWGSSWGADIKDAPDAVDILAPSQLPCTDIRGPAGWAPGDYAQNFNGVSCSVPYVAGVAALIKSRHPDWTPAQIRHQLLSTAQDIVDHESGPGWDRYSGYGMVDLDAAAGCSTTPPSITVELERDTLWPPNHQMVPLCATVTATDDCGTTPDVALVSIVSSEPDVASDFAGAEFGTDDRCFDLRAERMGGADGRRYTIVYSATDATGNVAYDTVMVQVPHDWSAAANETPRKPDPAGAVATGPRFTALTSIEPNPFHPQTTVHFALPEGERVRISIHDITGARVRQLVDETMPSGQHRVRWDGRSDRGAGVASGVYFVRMTAGSYSAVRRIVMLE